MRHHDSILILFLEEVGLTQILETGKDRGCARKDGRLEKGNIKHYDREPIKN
jgi:hypothetical protein